MTDLIIQCPQHFYQRSTKLYKKGYEVLSQSARENIENKMLEDLSHLDIVGTRIHTHAYGLNDSLPNTQMNMKKTAHFCLMQAMEDVISFQQELEQACSH